MYHLVNNKEKNEGIVHFIIYKILLLLINQRRFINIGKNMNKVYKLVWSGILGAWVVVSENSKGKKNLQQINSLQTQS